jgi:hypothetical protein
MIIRSQQMDVLEDARARDFVTGMVEHLRTFAPQLSRILGEERIHKVVESGIGRAQAYGLTNRGPVRFFIDLMFALGNGFDTDPQLPWAAAILGDSRIPDQMLRADRLYRAMKAYMDEVAGPDNAHAMKALKNLLAALKTPTPADAPGDLPSRILNGFRTVYPQKCEFVGEPGLKALIEEAVQFAASRGLTPEAHTALCAGLMFGFGHGIFQDPLYPWVAATLEDPQIPTLNERASRLADKTRVYVEAMLRNIS